MQREEFSRNCGLLPYACCADRDTKDNADFVCSGDCHHGYVSLAVVMVELPEISCGLEEEVVEVLSFCSFIVPSMAVAMSPVGAGSWPAV